MTRAREKILEFGSPPASASRSPHRGGAVIFVACLSLLLGGCTAQDPGQTDRVIQNAPDPVGEARSMLQAYAAGGPIGSEAEGFDGLVARVKAVDAAKGDALAAFVAEARRSADGLAERAKKLLAEF